MSKEEYPLSRGEYNLVKKLANAGVEKGYVEEVSQKHGIEEAQLHSLLLLLQEKGLVKVRREEESIYVTTSKGLQALREGLPEEKLVRLLEKSGGSLVVGKVKEELGPEAGIAIGQARRKGYINIEKGRVILARDPQEILREISELKKALQLASEGGLREAPKELVERGLVTREIIRRTWFEFTTPPRAILDNAVVEVARLSHKLLVSGEWRRVRLKKYDVRAEPPEIYPARKHFLGEFIEMLKDIMKELGFVEVRGPIVDIELFNFDILFQAQDHPAREIHDTLRVKEPKRVPLDEYSSLVERVARVHEKGWGYKWNPEIAARVLLRSQTTAVSARVLARRPEPPIRFFTLGRVYRSDVVDSTHLPEFHQLDGIMGWPGYTFRDLIGILREVAGRLGLELRLKPGYFPFTEPSVEGYVRLPNGKWLELFGAGLFRPEVLEAVGVDYPVGAWGFGVERLAAAFYGVNDIRDLYTRDVEKLRRLPVKIF